ncbi:hypothetical protein ACE1ET_04625 [Saccharicrinis sp. FJH62]|uniref:hypothetical protein n=1 Tax=Saccharicrinis sp. FJH62 TaxID=3344657 RepID=UPI0035D4394A
MKSKCFVELNSLRRYHYLLIVLIVALHTSCEEENVNLNQIFNFYDYAFINGIVCYDSTGIRLDSSSYMFNCTDFIYPAGFEIPYEKIEIKADSTVVLHFTVHNIKNARYSRISQKHDTLYFYTDNAGYTEFSFKGLLIGNVLRLPGYGYIYYKKSCNGAACISETKRITSLGFPDTEGLINAFPEGPIINYPIHTIKTLYIQQYELVYLLHTE